MATPCHIAVVTGSRAEFGLLLAVMRAIGAHPKLKLSTIVTGTHLTRSTWRDVVQAGFSIDAKVTMQRKNESGYAADVAALSRGIAGLGQVFAKLKPDVVLVLGDRIEAFAAASAASIGGLRLAHIHGGDRAEGVADEAMRHAISKLAHFHFAATAQSQRRLIRMGEPRDCVMNVGSPAADGLHQVIAAADAPQFIIMQHPIGGSDAHEAAWMKLTLAATVKLGNTKPTRLILAPNSDPGSAGIGSALAQRRVVFTEHLPRHAFLSLLKGSLAIIGNSSAGLIEAAILGVPCVNVGPRQNGREKPGNVIDCDYGKASVQKAIAQAMTLRRDRIRHPYGDGNTGKRIAMLLANLPISGAPPRKQNSY